MRWVTEALGQGPTNGSEPCLKLDDIMIHCLQAERVWMNGEDTKPANELELTLKSTLSVEMA